MLTYLFTASLLLFAFSLGYYLFLRQGPALNLRRRVLLLGIVGTFLLPFCPSPSVPEAFTTTPVHVEEFTNWVGEESTLDEGAELGLGALAISEPEFVTEIYAMLMFKELRIILLVYLLGVLIFLGKLIIGLVRLYRLHRASRPSGTPNLRLLERDGDAFTFGKTVYLSESVFYASDADVILEHEQTHAREWHTLDALLAELMRAFFWFHPLAWWVRDQVQVNLEYLADQGVLRAGYDKRSYQLSLVAHQHGTDMRTSLLPQFAAKGIKRRIKMMAFRAGPQVRSLLMSGVIVFVCFALFTMTNGRAQELAPQTDPVELQLREQLGLNQQNEKAYKFAFFELDKEILETPTGVVSSKSYLHGAIEGTMFSMINGAVEDITPADVTRVSKIPRSYFNGRDEITEDDFFDFFASEKYAITVALRFDGPKDWTVVRLDPIMKR